MSDNDDKQSPLAPVGVSPLAEADPHSLDHFIEQRIDKIMNMRPNELIGDKSDAALMQMVQYYRARRAQFILDSQTKAPRAKPGATPAKSKVAPKSVAEVTASFGVNKMSDLL